MALFHRYIEYRDRIIDFNPSNDRDAHHTIMGAAHGFRGHLRSTDSVSTSQTCLGILYPG